jgi:hypothetical protein
LHGEEYQNAKVVIKRPATMKLEKANVIALRPSSAAPKVMLAK